MSGKGPSDSQIATQNNLTAEQVALGQSQDKRSQELYNLTEPGLKTAEDFYKHLASGDKGAIQRSTAPATEQIAGNYEQAVKNLSENMPRGGAKDLAVQEAEISKSGAIGSTEANAYLGAFPALASLAQGGIGLSINEVTQALSAFSGASSSNQAAANMQGAGKAQTLGFLGSLGGAAGEAAGGGAFGHLGGCWVAEAVFGETDLRTVRLRVFLNDVWGKTWLGRNVMWVYRKVGRGVARQIRAHNWLRRIFTPLFEYADRCAYRWEYSKLAMLRDCGVI